MATITGTASTSINAFVTVSDDGQPIDEAESAVTAQQITNDLATIKAGSFHKTAGIMTFDVAPVFAAGAHISQAQTITADGTGATIAGAWIITGTITATGPWGYGTGGGGGPVTFNDNVRVAPTGMARIQGRKVWDRARVVLTDANHTIDVTQGDRFEIPDPAAARVIILDEATGSPAEGERLTFFAKLLQVDRATYVSWNFKTTTGPLNTVALFIGSLANNATGTFTWATFEMVSGVWRLAENSGQAYDGTNVYGCLAGVGTHP